MMKIVVSDSTPLISLMKADLLDLLARLFGEVLIPEAVFQEVTTNEEFKDEAEKIKKSSFIRVVKVENTDRVSFLRRVTGLDLGESEAIIFADEAKADLLLMDEVAGRKVAQNMSLPMIGTVGIIVRAFRVGIISEKDAEEVFDKLRKSRRHISERLIHDALDAIHGN
jgi:predicted nucleic acid-binding protein